jgi:hypothetical protein
MVGLTALASLTCRSDNFHRGRTVFNYQAGGSGCSLAIAGCMSALGCLVHARRKCYDLN